MRGGRRGNATSHYSGPRDLGPRGGPNMDRALPASFGRQDPIYLTQPVPAGDPPVAPYRSYAQVVRGFGDQSRYRPTFNPRPQRRPRQPYRQQPRQQPLLQQPRQQQFFQQPVFQQPRQQPFPQQPLLQQPRQQPLLQQPRQQFLQQPVFQQPRQQPFPQQPLLQQPLLQLPGQPQQLERAPPDLARVSRQLFKIIKIIHHSTMVAPDQACPRFISNLTYFLSTVIKPALPTELVEDLVVGNAKQWEYSTMLALRDHYKGTLDNLLGELERGDVGIWREAFDLAVRWIKRKFKRVEEGTLATAEAHFQVFYEGQDLLAGGEEGDQGGSESDRTPSTSMAVVPPPTPARTTTGVATSGGLGTSSSSAARPGPSFLNVTDLPLGSDEPSPVDRRLLPPPPLIPLPAPVAAPKKTKEMGEIPPVGTWNLPLPDPGPTNTSTPSLANPTQARVVGDGETVEPPSPPISETLTDLIELAIEESSIQHPVDPDPDPEPGRSDESRFELSQEEIDQILEEVEPPTFSPNIHLHTQNKLMDWQLRVKKKILIVGDSNLARFPSFHNSDVQVESYPGATFLHAQNLFDKCAVDTKRVEQIILSFGVNCRLQRLAVIHQQLDAAVRTAQRRFPKAVIKVPLINFSEKLPLPEKQIIQKINTYLMESSIGTIPLLEGFGTGPDQIHWNMQTAKRMWAHWIKTLNW